jgi:hypothetical protein
MQHQQSKGSTQSVLRTKVVKKRKKERKKEKQTTKKLKMRPCMAFSKNNNTTYLSLTLFATLSP